MNRNAEICVTSNCILHIVIMMNYVISWGQYFNIFVYILYVKKNLTVDGQQTTRNLTNQRIKY